MFTKSLDTYLLEAIFFNPQDGRQAPHGLVFPPSASEFEVPNMEVLTKKCSVDTASRTGNPKPLKTGFVIRFLVPPFDRYQILVREIVQLLWSTTWRIIPGLVSG